ncbi:HAMP domain-containing histidine kinase [Thiotrichales bacterium 19S3-7]|nr:HAMP domain-containing histidine kinase [Thiotrichales bacterium 19S3-7]MCF6802424.1 HAMP domain-containing histidine kinase [Thiotrichales bacterium 19S3-11]
MNKLEEQVEILQAAYKREKKARKEAEAVLEDKVRSLYHLSNKLNDQFNELLKTHERFRVLQNKLIQAKKMETFGEVFTGILHEINNPLASIQSNAELLKVNLAKDDLEEVSEDLLEASKRISSIINSLSIFKNDHLILVPIKECISMAINIAKCKFKNSVQIEKNYDEKEIYIHASQRDIIQLFIQIISNCDQHSSNRVNVKINIIKRLGCVVVQFIDNGPGISDNIIENIFNPFYTTDPLLKKGIGLYSCYQICKLYSGKIRVYSEVDKGSKVSVLFPIRNQL